MQRILFAKYGRARIYEDSRAQIFHGIWSLFDVSEAFKKTDE